MEQKSNILPCYIYYFACSIFNFIPRRFCSTFHEIQIISYPADLDNLSSSIPLLTKFQFAIPPHLTHPSLPCDFIVSLRQLPMQPAVDETLESTLKFIFPLA